MIQCQWNWRVLLPVLGVLMSIGAYAQQPVSQAPDTWNDAVTKLAGPVLEERAINLLKATGGRLADARSLSLTAVTYHERPSLSGQPLVNTTKSEVLLQWPDRLRVITPGDDPASGFYYDGKTVTVFSPGENFVFTAAAPPMIDAALQIA